MSRRNTLLIAAGAAVAVVVAAVVVYLAQDAPDAVDIDAAVGQVDEPDDAAGPDDDAGPVDAGADDAREATADEGDHSGTWTVDTSIGTFSVTESTGTFVGFRVDEELTGPGEVEAIGRTPAVTGSLNLDDTVVTEARFEADMTQLVSDRSRRDSRMREAVGAADNPTATFELTEPLDLGGQPAADQTVEVEAAGELTVNGVTRPVTVPLEAAVRDGVLVVTGSFPIVFADHDVTPPSAPVVVSVDDNGIVELQLFLARD